MLDTAKELLNFQIQVKSLKSVNVFIVFPVLFVFQILEFFVNCKRREGR
jgi:hypothetical protein